MCSCQVKNKYFLFLYVSLLVETIYYEGNIMGVIILFGFVIGLVATILIVDQITWSKYPISDEYWIAGLTLIAFLAGMIAMII